MDKPAERVGEPAGAPRGHPDPGILSTDVHALIGAIGVGVMIYDAEGRIVDAGPVGQVLADVTPASVVALELVQGTDVWLSVKETAVDRWP